MFAIETFFDEASETRVRAVWQRIAAAGLPSTLLAHGHTPHVSLAVAEDLDPLAFAPVLAAFAASEPALSIRLASAATFATAEGVLFLGVVATRVLLERHERFHSRFERAARGAWPYYRPGHWVPHCTLTTGLTPKQLGAALELCAEGVLPLDVTLSSVAIVEPRRAKIHARFPFAPRE